MNDRKNITGILLLNLGGPDSLDAVRPFLYNLFSDRDIIRLGPSFLQKPIAWMISTFRAEHTAGMYRKIGGKSPILDITTAQAAALEDTMNKGNAGNGTGQFFKVYIGMRYWHPFTRDVLKAIMADGIKDLIALSLYPHYSKATTGSSVIDLKKEIAGLDIRVHYIEQWPDHPGYIGAMAGLAAEGIARIGSDDYEILYSAHSLPRSFIDEGDPYLDHIHLTMDKINERLFGDPHNIKKVKTHLSFQSKTGPVKWLEPSTEETIVRLSQGGCRNLFVIPISFVSDHIETLYEIDIQYRELALEHGMKLHRCRALNTAPAFIASLKDLVLSVPSGS
jgi:ferrochelatase